MGSMSKDSPDVGSYPGYQMKCRNLKTKFHTPDKCNGTYTTDSIQMAMPTDEVVEPSCKMTSDGKKTSPAVMKKQVQESAKQVVEVRGQPHTIECRSGGMSMNVQMTWGSAKCTKQSQVPGVKNNGASLAYKQENLTSCCESVKSEKNSMGTVDTDEKLGVTPTADARCESNVAKEVLCSYTLTAVTMDMNVNLDLTDHATFGNDDLACGTESTAGGTAKAAKVVNDEHLVCVVEEVQKCVNECCECEEQEKVECVVCCEKVVVEKKVVVVVKGEEAVKVVCVKVLKMAAVNVAKQVVCVVKEVVEVKVKEESVVKCQEKAVVVEVVAKVVEAVVLVVEQL